MTNEEWRLLLGTARRLLGRGANLSWESESWCAWTTFSSLEQELTYWARGLPEESELLEDQTMDGGLWAQSFFYADLAHLIIPRQFSWERFTDDCRFQQGAKHQNILRLSDELNALGLQHGLTERVLEVKLF